MITMTPKEKAEELIHFYENILEPFTQYIPHKIIHCALITVDDRLIEIDDGFESCNDVISIHNYLVTKQRYWEEVKQILLNK